MIFGKQVSLSSLCRTAWDYWHRARTHMYPVQDEIWFGKLSKTRMLRYR